MLPASIETLPHSSLSSILLIGSINGCEDAMNNLMTQEEVSEFLRVPLKTLYQWRCYNKYDLPFVKFGRGVRYRREDVEAFVERHLTEGRKKKPDS